MTYNFKTYDWKTYSATKGKKFLGAFIVDENGKPLNGEKKMKDGTTIVRFKEGLVDGGNLPAIESENGDTEYWEKGYPNGRPAVITNFGTREEDWIAGRLVAIRSELEITAFNS